MERKSVIVDGVRWYEVGTIYDTSWCDGRIGRYAWIEYLSNPGVWRVFLRRQRFIVLDRGVQQLEEAIRAAMALEAVEMAVKS